MTRWPDALVPMFLMALVVYLKVCAQRSRLRRAAKSALAQAAPQPAARTAGGARRAQMFKTGTKEAAVCNVKATFDLVCEYFRTQGYGFLTIDEQNVVDLTMRGTTAFLRVKVRVGSDPLLLVITVQIPTVVPNARRVAGAETVARANCGLRVGSFDLDMSRGTLWFRASVPVVDATLTSAQFGATFQAALTTADRYNRAFCRLLYGDDLSPAEVIAEVEMAGA